MIFTLQARKDGPQITSRVYTGFDFVFFFEIMNELQNENGLNSHCLSSVTLLPETTITNFILQVSGGDV